MTKSSQSAAAGSRKKRTTKQWKSRPGSQISDKEAALVGPILERIGNQVGRALHPQDVLDEAANSASPLHAFFEWDDSVAAVAWRRRQATNLIGAVHVIEIVERESGEKEEVSVRNFYMVTTAAEPATKKSPEKPPGRGYVSLNDVKADAALIDQVITQCAECLRNCLKRYETYKSLPKFKERFSAVIDAIEKL